MNCPISVVDVGSTRVAQARNSSIWRGDSRPVPPFRSNRTSASTPPSWNSLTQMRMVESSMNSASAIAAKDQPRSSSRMAFARRETRFSSSPSLAIATRSARSAALRKLRFVFTRRVESIPLIRSNDFRKNEESRYTKEIVQCFWALSKELADARHYPAVDWVESFSGYVASCSGWWADHVDPRWAERRAAALGILSQAEELARIVNLVGPEALSQQQRWALEGVALFKEGVLQQSALDPVDSYCSPQKQFALLDQMLSIYRQGLKLLELGVPVQELLRLPLLANAQRLKGLYRNEQLEELRSFATQVTGEFERLTNEYAQHGKTTA